MPPTTTADRKWSIVVLVAVYCGIVILSTSVFMSGVFYIEIMKHFHGDSAMTSLIGALNSGLMTLLSPLVSVLMDRYSCRTSIVAGSVIIVCAFLLTAFVNNLQLLIFTYGILVGIGNSLVSTPYVVVLGYYFEKRRNLVISMSVAVIGLGMFLASPLAFAIIDYYGLHGSFLILSAITAHLCVVGIICRPSKLEIEFQKLRRLKALDHQKQNSTKCVCPYFASFGELFSSLSSKRIWTNWPLLLFLLSTLTWNLLLAICLVHLPNYAAMNGADSLKITGIMTTFSVSNTAGRFIAGILTEVGHVNSLLFHVSMLLLGGVLTLTFPFYSYLRHADYGIACMVGLFTGAPNSLMTPITLTMVELELLSAAHGMENLFAGLGCIFGPPLSGVLLSSTGNYASSFICAGSIVILGSISAFISYCLTRAERRSKSLDRTRSIPDVVLQNEALEILVGPTAECSRADDVKGNDLEDG